MFPYRFIKKIDAHLLGNLLDLSGYPLIMAIIGRPGVGKTYLLRHYLSSLDFHLVSVSAADLESDRAGEPAKLLQKRYVEASNAISKGIPAALVIDDIDTTLGEWEHNTGTVNHQDILALFMHIADDPTHIDEVRNVKRVPIFFTGNYFNRMYQPLVRDGRVTRFEWEPTTEEKIMIVRSILPNHQFALASKLVNAYPDETIAFYSSLLAQKQAESMADIASDVDYKNLIVNNQYQQNLRREIETAHEDILRQLDSTLPACPASNSEI